MNSPLRSLVTGAWIGPITFTLAVCLVWRMAGLVPWFLLAAWLLALAALHAWHLYRRGATTTPEPRDWLLAPVFPLGLVWGAVVFFMPFLPDDERLILVCVLLAVDAVAKTVIHVYLKHGQSPKWYAFPAGIFVVAALPVLWLNHDAPTTLLVVLVMLLATALRRMLGFLVTYGFMVAGHNVELRKDLAKAVASLEESNRNKTQLLTTASHDLRQPVHALGLLIEELRLDPGREDRQDRIAVIRNLVFGLSDSLNVLMNAACLEAGIVQVEAVPVALKPLLESLHTEFMPMAREKNLSFTVEAEDLWVVSDPSLLTRMVSNLVSNAIRYTSIGKVEIRATRHGSLGEILVLDTGRGIDPERLSRIFEENQRIEVADRLRGGMGLGLSIVRRQAQLLGHTVSAQSVLGAGSGFTIRAQAFSPTQEQVVDFSQSDSAIHLPYRILLVEDDPVVLRGMAQLFQSLGCEAMPVHDHLKWLERGCNQEDEADVIVTDYHLGGGATGLDVIRHSRKCQDRRVPAILLTGDINSELVELARDESVMLLYKPIRPAQMKDALFKALT